MSEVKLKVKLLDVTKNPGPLVESIAEISYQTQRFFERKHPKLIKFGSGRVVPYEEFGLEVDPEIGEPLPGYVKDDNYVSEIIPASWENVVKFILAIGHHTPLQCCHATFKLHVTRKCALHLLRYEFCTFNMQSQKYRNQGSFEYLLPDLDDVPFGVRKTLGNYMKTAQATYEELRKTGVDPEWSRAVYPNNVLQIITMGTNFRQWRHIFDCLCDDDYVGEDQDVMLLVLDVLQQEAPVFFDDFVIAEDRKSARRKARKYSRNKKVNWTLSPQQKEEFGIEIPKEPAGSETDIP
ncbi:MAG: hypothetical protein FVQ80_06640 [Planctomycetes bacterium]|nr:hypothetical protein [Planctomycetota bacterium]